MESDGQVRHHSTAQNEGRHVSLEECCVRQRGPCDASGNGSRETIGNYDPRVRADVCLAGVVSSQSDVG